jgi:hypothetical protein
MNLPVGFRRVCSEASGTFPGNLRFSDLLSAGTARYEALHGTPSLLPLLSSPLLSSCTFREIAFSAISILN